MLTFPHFDPVAFTLGPISVHWYGIMYLLGFAGAWWLARWRLAHYHLTWTPQQLDDLIFYAAIGVILGGRLGYMVFYGTAHLLHNPLSLFKLWEGGMSFHGGLVGVILAMAVFARTLHRPFLEVTDFIAPLVPFGLALGRIGNFINGELWGRVTDVPWAMVFPLADGMPRHPSQLYELGLEGILLFTVLWWYASKPRAQGRVSGLFLIIYSISRFLVEGLREPDPQLGYLAFDWLTMGQVLSLPMLIIGIWLWKRATP